VEEILFKARTLTEALPWIKRFQGRKVVVKYGGSAMTDEVLRESVAQDIVLMKLVGINPVIVHGGGKAISEQMERLGLEVQFLHGLRVTDDEAMEVVKKVLVDKVNKSIVDAINAHGRLAVGISGDDTGLIHARPISDELGRAGEVDAIDITVVDKAIGDGLIPVIASIGVGDDGGSYNINADIVAGELTARLGADKIIYLTDVDGLYADFSDKSSLISALTLEETRGIMTSGVLATGMIPKVDSCVRALDAGVTRAHILNGTVEHALLLEVYTDEGVGTMITHSSDGGERA